MWSSQLIEKKHLTKFTFIIKTLKKLELEGKYHIIIKAIYEKPTANNIIKGKRLKTSLRLGIRQGCLPSPLLFNTILEVLVRVTGQEKEIKGGLSLWLSSNEPDYYLWGPAQWVEDLALPWAGVWVADMAWILHCCGCRVGHSCSSNSTPGLGTSICHKYGPKKQKGKKKKRNKGHSN